MSEYTDSKGRTLTDRILAVHRHGDPITHNERVTATKLLEDLVEAAERNGFGLDDFDWTIDLPGGCLDVVTAKTRRHR